LINSLPPKKWEKARALVDDEEGHSLLFKAEVGELGPDITTFGSPLKFLEYLEEQKAKENPFKFDFVVTDVNMPEMTGLELLQKLIDDYGFTKTQLFVLSGGMPNFLERKIKKLALDIFSKPLDLSHIGHALSSVPQTTSPKLPADEILRNLIDLCEYLGPKVKTSLTLVEFKEGKHHTLYVNQAFEQESEYSLKEVYGKNLKLLQGKNTNKEAVLYMRENFKKGETFVVDILNYTKTGTPFKNRLVLLPLIFSHGTFYFGLQTNLDEFTKEGQCALHEDIMMTLNLPVNKVMQELLTLFYGNQLKGQIFQEMSQKLIEEIENIRHYILKF
jgi:CheY-like chemotaxis protein